MKLGERLASFRKEKGMSQEELAEQFNVTRQTVSNWETGKSLPDVETLVTISEYFGIPVDDLLKDNQSEVILSDEVATQKPSYKILLGVILIVVALGSFVVYQY